MIIVFILSLVLTLILNFYKAEAIICRPPNVFQHIFAPPGVGKTTLAAKIVRDSNRAGKKVYSNVPLLTAYQFDLKDLGKYDFQNCTIIIDEAGCEVNNRNWHTNLNDKQVEFLKKHRHYNVDIYLFSQAYNDVDNKFRDLTTSLLLLKKSKLPFFVNAIAIRKTMDLINGQIVQYFEYDRHNSFRFFVVNLWAYFNSYEKKLTGKVKKALKYMKSDTYSNK